MSSIKLTADSGGGTFEIKAPSSSANTRVLTLPDTGNLTLGGPYGKILQVVSVTKTDTASTSSSTYSLISGLSASITPSSSSNKILVTLTLGAFAGQDVMDFLLTNGASTGGVIIQGDVVSGKKSVSAGSYAGGDSTGQGWYGIEGQTVQKLNSPASTSQQTYYVYWKVNTGTGYLNRNKSDTNQYAFRTGSTITLMEIAA